MVCLRSPISRATAGPAPCVEGAAAPRLPRGRRDKDSEKGYEYESASVSKTGVPQLHDRAAPWRGAGHLQRAQAQATPGLNGRPSRRRLLKFSSENGSITRFHIAPIV